MPEPPRIILIAALHWGLGHATRCVPLIKAFQQQNYQIILASDGAAGLVLQRHFPELPYYELPGYHIRYPGESLAWHLLRQSPQILRAIRLENQMVAELMAKYQFPVILSDNRYGCYHPKAKNLFLSHQLQIIGPNSLGSWLANRVQHYLLHPFQEIWVPDSASEPSLSGTLGHPQKTRGQTIRFLGPLSRFSHSPRSPEEKFILAIVSGPEPERSRFARLLLGQLEHIELPSQLILGLPGGTPAISSQKVDIVPYLDGPELQAQIAKAKYLISRSGYSTLMDLQQLRKKALLIPTPGQPEQLYLAQRMEKMSWLPAQDQRAMNLREGIQKIQQYAGLPLTPVFLPEVITQL